MAGAQQAERCRSTAADMSALLLTHPAAADVACGEMPWCIPCLQHWVLVCRHMSGMALAVGSAAAGQGLCPVPARSLASSLSNR
jgi:hypothetical protein